MDNLYERPSLVGMTFVKRADGLHRVLPILKPKEKELAVQNGTKKTVQFPEGVNTVKEFYAFEPAQDIFNPGERAEPDDHSFPVLAVLILREKKKEISSYRKFTQMSEAEKIMVMQEVQEFKENEMPRHGPLERDFLRKYYGVDSAT